MRGPGIRPTVVFAAATAVVATMATIVAICSGRSEAAPAVGASASTVGGILPWGGAIAESPKLAYKGPYQATLACKEGVQNFPFLKPWVAKLDNFVAPVEIGSTEGSLFYAIGVTTALKGAVDEWIKDSYKASVDWKEKGGSIESQWLGKFPGFGPAVAPGPGYATVTARGREETWSQMGSRHDTEAGRKDPAIQGYASNAIADAKAVPPAMPSKTPPFSPAWQRFWALAFSPAELELLETCTSDDCKIKFAAPELQSVIGASHQYRVAQYRRVIESRLEQYQSHGKVWAYEGTTKPMDWEDLPIGPEFPAKYDTHFWEPSNRASYGFDVLDAEPGHQKPVVGLYSRQCEKRGTGAGQFTACTDIVVYNNHYFDYWARLVFFFPWCDVQVALAYETLDIDQIKESRVVRILFGGEIRKLMEMLLETRLKRLHMLGV